MSAWFKIFPRERGDIVGVVLFCQCVARPILAKSIGIWKDVDSRQVLSFLSPMQSSISLF